MSDIDTLIAQTAQRYNLDANIFRRQLIQESGLNPNARNPSGAAGIAQFMPATAAGMGIDPMDPAQAIPAAGQYMRQNLNRFGGSYDHALAAYNWGPGNVAKHGLENMPAETRKYLANIKGSALLMPSPSDRPMAAAPMAAAPVPDTPDPGLAPPPDENGPPTLADMFQLAAKRAQGVA